MYSVLRVLFVLSMAMAAIFFVTVVAPVAIMIGFVIGFFSIKRKVVSWYGRNQNVQP